MYISKQAFKQHFMVHNKPPTFLTNLHNLSKRLSTRDQQLANYPLGTVSTTPRKLITIFSPFAIATDCKLLNIDAYLNISTNEICKYLQPNGFQENQSGSHCLSDDKFSRLRHRLAETWGIISHKPNKRREKRMENGKNEWKKGGKWENPGQWRGHCVRVEKVL